MYDWLKEFIKLSDKINPSVKSPLSEAFHVQPVHIVKGTVHFRPLVFSSIENPGATDQWATIFSLWLRFRWVIQIFWSLCGVSNPWGAIVLGVTNPVESISPGAQTLACQYPWCLIPRESISPGEIHRELCDHLFLKIVNSLESQSH